MAAYRVQLFREAHLVFRGIEADCAEDAARIASAQPTVDAHSVDEPLPGSDTSAVVYQEGEDLGARLVFACAPTAARSPRARSRSPAAYAHPGRRRR